MKIKKYKNKEQNFTKHLMKLPIHIFVQKFANKYFIYLTIICALNKRRYEFWHNKTNNT